MARTVVPCNVYIGRRAVRCFGMAATLGNVESPGSPHVYPDTSPTPIHEKNVQEFLAIVMHSSICFVGL